MNTGHIQQERAERVVVTGEKRGGGSFVDYCHKDSAAKYARFYRGRGYTVKTWTVDAYHQHLAQQDAATQGPTTRTLTDAFNKLL